MAVFEESKPEVSLSPLEWLAVQLVGKHAANFRSEVQPGKAQPVDLLLRIQGTVTVGEDHDTTNAQAPKLDNMLGHIAKRLPPETWEMVRQAILEDAKANGGVLPGCEEGWAAKAKGLVTLLTRRTSSPCKGSTKGSFRVGQVDQTQLSPVAASSVQKFTRAIMLSDE